MTGVQCEKCGGNIYEAPNGTCYCDTCGYVKYPDDIVINGVNNNDNEEDI